MVNQREISRAQDLADILLGRPQVCNVHLFDEDALDERQPHIYLVATVPASTFRMFLAQLKADSYATTTRPAPVRRTAASLEVLGADRDLFNRIGGKTLVSVFLFPPRWRSNLKQLDDQLKMLDPLIATNLGQPNAQIRRFDPFDGTFVPAA